MSRISPLSSPPSQLRQSASSSGLAAPAPGALSPFLRELHKHDGGLVTKLVPPEVGTWQLNTNVALTWDVWMDGKFNSILIFHWYIQIFIFSVWSGSASAATQQTDWRKLWSFSSLRQRRPFATTIGQEWRLQSGQPGAAEAAHKHFWYIKGSRQKKKQKISRSKLIELFKLQIDILILLPQLCLTVSQSGNPISSVIFPEENKELGLYLWFYSKIYEKPPPTSWRCVSLRSVIQSC